ncbi:hypothetical protein AB0M46_04350 [Dactylosporangium sp. NPDC051485]|uniref:hypothetical protein n=1 Tax=Dactylosporangium sp. NPDC051485 TaxID=3154846 RepID=UPI00341F69BE
MTAPLTLDVATNDDTLTIAAHGNLDLTTCHHLLAATTDATATNVVATIVLDLTDLGLLRFGRPRRRPSPSSSTRKHSAWPVFCARRPAPHPPSRVGLMPTMNGNRCVHADPRPAGRRR